MQRVVVTGLGAVTPLGLGAQRTWTRLLDGRCGIVSLAGRSKIHAQQQCQVAGLVPRGNREDGGWTAGEWLSGDEQRRMSTFMQYAMAASSEALDDAGWRPNTDQQRERTGVCLGSGIGSLEVQYQTSVHLYQGSPKKVSPLFVPMLLINLAAGHIAIKYGFKVGICS